MRDLRVIRTDVDDCEGCGFCPVCRYSVELREARLGEVVRKLGALTAGLLVFGASWVIAVVLARLIRP